MAEHSSMAAASPKERKLDMIIRFMHLTECRGTMAILPATSITVDMSWSLLQYDMPGSLEQIGGILRKTDQIHDATHGLSHHVGGLMVPIWACLPEGSDGCQDRVGIHLP